MSVTLRVLACLVLLSSCAGAAAQHVDTQPSPPYAHAPFAAFVYFAFPFASDAKGFDPASVQVQGNTVVARFDATCSPCTSGTKAGPFTLAIPALPPGDYTLDVRVSGFSPPLPDQSFTFSVSAAAAPSQLPANSTATLAFLLAGVLLVGMRILKRRAN
jgi:hypothetical protein